MGKRVKFSLDLVISDEKKEVAVKEPENTEIVPKSTGDVIVPGSARRTKRKKLFTIGLVMVGILLLGLGTYGIIRQGIADKVIEESPKYEVQEPQVQEPQVQEPVKLIDKTDESLQEVDMVELSDLVDGESSPCEGLSERINQFPTDPETRSIIEGGFYYELDNVVEDDIFKLEFVAATGIRNNPKLLLNIYVDDEELVAQNDKIEVLAYCLDKETYDTNIDDYGQWNAYGVQDKNDPHLYRVTLHAGSFLASGKWVVFDMTKIRIGTREKEWMEYQVNLKDMLHVPDQIAFCPTYGISTDGLKFETDTKTYKLYWTEVGYNYTNMFFIYDFETTYSGTTDGDGDWEQFNSFIKEVILEVDGVEYRVDPNVRPYINMSEDKNDLHYYVYATFPGVKDLRIQSIIVKYGDISYKLR